MASFSKSLFESEFFGHIRGAFTGALNGKRGFFEEAQGGSIFLDEISELDLELQGKFLRVMEEKELYPLGSTETRKIDVRFIASSNRDMIEEVNHRRFRSDLFYRLNVVHIHIPPLRDRKGDILPLACHFLKIHAKRNQKKIDSLASDLNKRLLEYPYPGNVRELESIIAEAVLLEKGGILTLPSARHLRHFLEHDQKLTDELPTLGQLERQHIWRALEATGGNRTRAAKILGIGLRTLQRKLKAFDRPQTGQEPSLLRHFDAESITR